MMGPGQQHGLRTNIGRAEKAAAGSGSWKATLIRSASVTCVLSVWLPPKVACDTAACVRTALPLALHIPLNAGNGRAAERLPKALEGTHRVRTTSSQPGRAHVGTPGTTAAMSF
jgi:hypothetical protein